jgi:hypothetical protein
VPHLPRVELSEAMLEAAVRGGLIEPWDAGGPSPAPSAAAACDQAGELVGILQPHASGRWRLRPNFRGA